jgi:hypothetical protein
VPHELAGRIACAVCEVPASIGPAFVVHVDSHTNEKGEVKAASHYACSETCCVELTGSLMVEFAFVGMQPGDDHG